MENKPKIDLPAVRKAARVLVLRCEAIVDGENRAFVLQSVSKRGLS